MIGLVGAEQVFRSVHVNIGENFFQGKVILLTLRGRSEKPAPPLQKHLFYASRLPIQSIILCGPHNATSLSVTNFRLARILQHLDLIIFILFFFTSMIMVRLWIRI
jgi:hypothetical protein